MDSTAARVHKWNAWLNRKHVSRWITLLKRVKYPLFFVFTAKTTQPRPQVFSVNEISKWMGRECNWATKYTGVDTEFELEWQKSKDKELTSLFWYKFNVSDFNTRFFSDLLRVYKMVWVIEGKIVWNWSEGNQNLLRVSGRFELSRVRITAGKGVKLQWI